MDNFFDVLKLDDFIELVRQMPLMGIMELNLDKVGWYRLARDIIAHEDLPFAHRSAMDGYAVMARDTFGASEANPAYLEVASHIAVQEKPQVELEPGVCAGIVTGASLPPGADSVVMVEYTHEMDQGTIEVRKPVAPWDNVMLQGEDVSAGGLVMKAGQTVTPRHMGMLAALGIGSVEVYGKPAVAVLSTGDELVGIDDKPGPGYIRDVNTYALGQMIRDEGCIPDIHGIIPDDETALREAIEKALAGNDVVLLSGGSSVGNRDYTIKAMSAISGLEVLVHGLALSPGKPTIFARKEGKCVWGLPGQVTSAQVVMMVLVIPFLRHLQGETDPFVLKEEFQVQATLSRNIASRYGRQDYVRVRLENDGGTVSAVPVQGKSGLMKTLVQSHGLIRIPENCEGLSRGDRVKVRLF